MKPFVACACALLAFANAACALSEYSVLLPELGPSILKAVAMPVDCGFVSAIDLDGLSVAQGSRFPASIAFYDSAKSSLGRARLVNSVSWFARTQGFAYYAALALCHHYAISAVNSASGAVKSSLESLDAQLAQFDALQDESDDYAQGVRNEVAEIRAHVDSASSQGSSMGQKLVSCSLSLRALNEDYPANIARMSVAGDLAGRDSVLSRAFALGTRIATAIEEMHFASVRQQIDLEQAYLALAQDKSAAESESLAEIPESSEFPDLEPFSMQSRRLDDLAERARLLGKQSREMLSSKQNGYLGRSLVLGRQALALLDEIHAASGEQFDAAIGLKSSLDKTVKSLEVEANEKTALRQSDPLALAFLQSQLAQYDSLAAAPSGKTIAKQISALLGRTGRLRRIIAYADSDDSFFYALADAKAAAASALRLISSAQKDGLQVEMQSQRLSAVSASLDALSEPSAQDYRALSEASAAAGEMSSQVEGIARAEFGSLESDYASAKSVEGMLGAQDRQTLQSLSSIFLGSRLNLPQAIGRLASARASLAQILGRIGASAPELLRAELEKGMAVDYYPSPADFGRSYRTLVRVRFESGLSLESGEAVRVKLPFPSSGLAVANSSAGLSISPSDSGAVAVFSGVRKGGYSAWAYFDSPPATIVSESERTVFASQAMAEKERKVVYRLEQPGKPVYRMSLPAGAGHTVSSAAPFADSSAEGVFAAEFDAPAGEGSFAVRYSSPHPFEASIRRETVPGALDAPESLVFSYSVANAFSDLDSVDLSFEETLACQPIGIEAAGEGLAANYEEIAGVLFVSLHSEKWQLGLRKSAVVRVKCGGLAEGAVKLKLAELQARAAALNDSSLEKPFFAAASLAEQGKWNSALDSAYSLEAAIESKEQAALPNAVGYLPLPSPTIYLAPPAAASQPAPSPASADLEQKLSLLKGYSVRRQGFAQAAAGCGSAFFSATASKLALAKTALAASKRLASALADLDGMLAYANQGQKLAAHPIESISALISDAESSSASLVSMNSEIRSMAEAEVNSASLRVAQFGSPADIEAAAAAKESLSAGHFLQAYERAAAVSATVPPGKAANPAQEWLWLAPIGLAGAAGIAIARGKQPSKVD
ncbi:MAG: hypothetical protein V1708_01725 [Candidatus Micrarchaeota archaeon]